MSEFKMKREKPPRLATLLLQLILRKDDFIEKSGDLEEVYFSIIEESNRVNAFVWYWHQTLKAVPSQFISSIVWEVVMFRSYLLTAIRNIKKHKGYSFINISGLAIGIACCLMIIMYIQDEFSYDKFHEKVERIYRVDVGDVGEGVPTNANSSFGVGPALAKDFADVEDFVRIRKMGRRVKIYIGYNEKKFYEEKFFFADSSFFNVFTFPLVEGDPATALKEPNSIVISESMAKKYFQNENPIGKQLETDPYNSGTMMYFTVTAVAKDVADNSHFHFDFLASFDNQKEDLNRFAGIWPLYTYVLLNQSASPELLESQFVPFIKRHWCENPWYDIYLQPIDEIRLYSKLNSEIEPVGDINDIYIFSIVALLVLIIASINFMNLSTARSAGRAKEVGLRKVVGAEKHQLIYQFLGESIITSFFGGLFALFLIALLLPIFNQTADKNFTLLMLADPTILIGLVSVILFIGLASGSYVAFILSSFNPVHTIKGIAKTKTSGKFVRRGLVVFQFVLSIAIIFCTITVREQMEYVKTQDTGYSKDELLVAFLNKDLRQNYEAFRSELVNHSCIKNTTTSSYVPTRGSAHNGMRYEGMNEDIVQVIYNIDKEFLDTYDLKLAAGENITHPLTKEQLGGILVSNSAYAEAGYKSPEDALGKRLTYLQATGIIKGIVNDINIYSFHEPAMATIYYITPIEKHDYVSIRLKGGAITESLEYIKSVWAEVTPNYPMEYFFLDESFDAMHRADQRLSEVFKYFGLLAIFVACMGLIGMAAFSAEQRRKEIGIRKTLGAPVLKIYYLLSMDLLKWVLIANLIALPIGYFVMKQWLQNFAYQIDIDLWLFIASGLLATSVAVITVSWQTIKASLANPINSLRSE